MALHMFGGDYEMDDADKTDETDALQEWEEEHEEGDRDREVDVVEHLEGKTPEVAYLLDDLRADMSEGELAALKHRVREDRGFARLVASYAIGRGGSAADIARQGGFTVRDKMEERTKNPPKIRRRKPGQTRTRQRGRKRLH